MTKAPVSKQKYDKAYNARPKQKKNRAARNASRLAALKAGRVRKGDGKDVHHPGGVAKNPKKTRVISASKNRSIK